MRSIFLLVLLFNITFQSWADVIVIRGTYQGKNLYVQNPFTGNLKNFCTEKVVINGVDVLANPKSSAYEIDLSYLNLDETVKIEIFHKEDCTPKILNQQVIKSKSNFEFTSFNVDEESVTWATKGEGTGGKFYVEQFMNNQWKTVIIDIKGKGQNANSYSLPPEHHSGVNKYRIKYVEPSGSTTNSKEVSFESSKIKVEIFPKRVTDYLYFKPEEPINYEIYDRFGKVVLKGKSERIDCSTLVPDVYTVVFDNQQKHIIKKDKSQH